MPNWAAYQEAYKRGILPGDKKAAYEEAVRRGLAPANKATIPITQESDVPEWGRKSPNLFGAYGAGKELIRQVVKPAAETTGMILGSLASPVAGTALGYGIGKKTGEIIEGQYGKLESPDTKFKTAGRETLGSLIDVGTVAAMGKGMDMAGRTLYGTETKLTPVIRKGIEKGIRPSVAGRRTFPQVERYLQNAETAVKEIINSKDVLRLTNEAGDTVAGLPKSLKQFSQAIDQNKKFVFEKYNNLAKQAGEKEARVDLVSIAKELKTIENDAIVGDLSPNISDYAAKFAERLESRGSYTTQEAQKAIATLNNSLEAFYKNPSYENASRAQIDAMVANRLRFSLDDVIESATGQQYQELKNVYGSLKAIERDVNRRSIVDARKNIKGLVDFSDIFSGSQVMYGIATMNPAIIGSGVTAKAISGFMKWRNNPNRIITNMFKDAEKIMQRNKL